MIIIAFLLAAIDTDSFCAEVAKRPAPAAATAAMSACTTDQEVMCYTNQAERLANGTGVKRNLAAAEWLLCQAADEIAPAELEGMLEHVAEMRAGTTNKPLSFCDHVTSGRGGYYCASIRWDEEMPRLDARIAKAKLPAALRSKGLAFVDAEAERIGELTRGGTGYSGFVLDAQLDTKQAFVEALESYAKRRAPAASEADVNSADADLNAAYRDAQANLEDMESEDFKTLLRDAQRAWISYRDAFAEHYVTRWRGSASPEALRREIVAALSRARAKDLRD